MNTEQKAKAYDEAIRKLRGMMPNWERLSYNGKTFLQDLIHIFPELEESEDERIRKAILELVRQSSEILDKQNQNNMIAWLEKQGEQKPAVIIPKFRVGDEIKTFNEESLTITKIDEKGYWSEDLFICDFDSECVWDLVEQNPAEWSEEDERILLGIIDELEANKSEAPEYDYKTYDKFIDWLESLKQRHVWKPSKEQMDAMQMAVSYFDYSWVSKEQKLLESLYKDLKKVYGRINYENNRNNAM